MSPYVKWPLIVVASLGVVVAGVFTALYLVVCTANVHFC